MLPHKIHPKIVLIFNYKKSPNNNIFLVNEHKKTKFYFRNNLKLRVQTGSDLSKLFVPDQVLFQSKYPEPIRNPT